MIALHMASEFVNARGALRTEETGLILDVAEFEFSKVNADGSRVDSWKLRRPYGKLEAGTRLSLKELRKLIAESQP